MAGCFMSKEDRKMLVVMHFIAPISMVGMVSMVRIAELLVRPGSSAASSYLCIIVMTLPSLAFC